MQLSSLIGHTQEILGKIRESNKPADSLIDGFFRSHKYLGSHDRRFIAETAYGALRHWKLCEWRLGSFGEHLLADDKLLLIVAAYLVGVERRQDISKDVIAKRILSHDLMETLPEFLTSLRTDPQIPPKPSVSRIALQHSFPEWMVQRFLDEEGEQETDLLCRSLNEQAPLTLRVNTLKTTVEDCQRALEEEGVETLRMKFPSFALTVKKRINVFGLQTFKKGSFEVQDAGSQALPLILDPKPTVRLLDACAGAGGKTLEFAALMKNRGEIVATDILEFRLQELRKRARRAGAFNIRPRFVNSIDEMADQYQEYFDIVFVDAPCTGTGTIRRNPGMKWTVSEEMARELAAKQLAILQSCVPLVKRSGRLAYATCSLFKEENEDVIASFLAMHPDFSILPINVIDQSGEVKDSVNFHRLLPHRHGTDGFFCAVLQKSIL